MTHPCTGHRCDHCYVCTKRGMCCITLSQPEKAALLFEAQSLALSALQVRMAELRRIWGDLSRMSIPPSLKAEQWTDTRSETAQLPGRNALQALQAAPSAVIDIEIKDTVQ